MGLFTPSISLLFGFISSLLLSLSLNKNSFFSNRKIVAISSIECFLGVFGTGLILFKRMEAVIYSVGVSEGCIILRVLNECSAEIDNTF